jgi:hypothetical protein
MLKREDVRDLMQQALDRAQWQALVNSYQPSNQTEGLELLDQLSLLTFSKSNLIHGAGWLVFMQNCFI